jgi:hypothetical protein
MEILAQFLLRLSFGLAAGMAITSPRVVSSGFFRNHLYVTLGLTTLAAIASRSEATNAFWYAVAAAVTSYIGSVCWLYEKKAAGFVAVVFVAMMSVNAALRISQPLSDEITDRYFSAIPTGLTTDELVEEQIAVSNRLSGASLLRLFVPLANFSSGLLLGITTAAMLLGHWYLNAPGMQLAPLRRLLLAAGIAVAIQAAVSAIGLTCELRYAHGITSHWLLFILLRWSFGLVGVAALLWMAWGTLKIPNTQSATGILYVAVIGVFVGELTGLLLSAESAFPL